MFVPNFVQISSSSTEILAFYEIQYGRRPPSGICWESGHRLRKELLILTVTGLKKCRGNER